MKNLVINLVGVITLNITIGCFSLNTEDPVFPLATRGNVVYTERIEHYSLDQLDSVLKEHIPDIFASMVQPAYDVEVYHLVYTTIDILGNHAQASGALVVPVNPSQALPMLSYQHGTRTITEQVPSRGLNVERQVLVGLVFAADGFAAVLPDYLGLGDNPGFHPFTHARTEVSASLDLLRAARHFCSNQGIPLTSELYLTGYSQGGHATMALHREIESRHLTEFDLVASAPMAGAYDLSGIIADLFLSSEPYPRTAFVPYLLMGYNPEYQFFSDLRAYFVQPYADQLPRLFDGTQGIEEINAELPPIPRDIFRPEVAMAIETTPSHPVRLALRDNDVNNWTPRKPMRMYHCEGDEIVPYEISVQTLHAFRDRGAAVDLLTPDNHPSLSFNHDECAQPALLGAREWFLSLLNP